MDPNVELFYEGIDDAESALGQCFSALRAAGVDLGDDRNAQRLRRISEDLGEIRDGVEENGLAS